MIAKGPLVVVAHPSLPVQNIRELIASRRASGHAHVRLDRTGTIVHLAPRISKHGRIKMTNVLTKAARRR